jgi:hypothetical protein
MSLFEFGALNFSYVGYGEHTFTPPSYGVKIFYWTGSSFALMGVASDGGGSDYDFFAILNEPDMLDVDEHLHVLVSSPVQNDTNISKIISNYVQVQTLKNATGVSYPYNLTLNVADDSVLETSHLHELSEKVTFSQELTAAFQSAVNAAGTGYGDVLVPLNFSSERLGRLNISNLQIIYDLDITPWLYQDIPDTIMIYEDSGWTDSRVNLNDHYTDRFGNRNLSFAVVYKQDESEVNCMINTSQVMRTLLFFTDGNFFGTSEFRVSATNRGADGIAGNADDKTTLSNLFTITVMPTNDPPEIYQLEFSGGGKKTVNSDSVSLIIGGQRAFEDLPYSMTVKAVDIDGDGLLYSCNLTDGIGADEHPRMSFDETNGILDFAPSVLDVGFVHINITVSDGIGSEPGTDYLKIELLVIAINDRPLILTTGPLVAYEDRLNKLDIEAYDEDDEQLIYSANLSDGAGTDDLEDFAINRDTGTISFLPHQDDVGTLWVNISVKDQSDEVAYRDLRIDVVNVNDAPEILNVGGLDAVENDDLLFEMNEGAWLNLSVLYTDEDNDPVSFDIRPRTPTTGLPDNFTVDEQTGKISFLAPMVELETHRTYFVNLTADDGNAERNIDSVWLEIQVNNANDPPVISGVDYDIDSGAVSFKLNASDPNNDDFKIVWDFGDGSNPIITYAFTTDRSYPGPGDYTVTITVIDTYNTTDTYSFDLNLTDDDFPGLEDPLLRDDDEGSSFWFALGITALVINVVILILIIFLIINRRKRALARRHRRIAEALMKSSSEGEVRKDLLGKDFSPGEGDDAEEPESDSLQTKLSKFGEIFTGKKDDES